MKRVTGRLLGFSFAVCALLSTKSTIAQTTYSIPSSVCSGCQDGAYGPVDICDGKYTAEADIFPSSSLTFGTVTKIAYDQIQGSASNVPIKIYMANTSASSFSADGSWSSVVSGGTLVYSGNVSFSSSGWNTITLTTPFIYSSGNLEVMIETDWGQSTVCTGNPVFYYYNASGNSDEFWEGAANSASALQSETGVIGSEPAPVQLTITACTNPTISAQPGTTTQNICQGGTATALSVTASGTSLTYQWYKNTTNSNSGGASISGATSTSYTPSSSTTGTSYYYCIVNSNGCTATSNVSGAININTIPTINSQSTGGQTLCQGSTATALSVSASGTSLTYQWYSNTANSNSGGAAISGATSSAYTPGTSNTGTTYYYCVVSSNGGCPVTSAVSGAIVVNGTAAPTGTTPQIFCSSSNPTVASLTATGTSILWYSSAAEGTPLSTSASLGNGTYYASQTVGGCQSVNTFSVAVTVNGAPTITSQSTGPQSVCRDSFAYAMSVTATGTSLTYQWYKDSTGLNSGGTLIAGATSSSYTPPTTKTGTWYYYCVVTGIAPCTQAVSNISGAIVTYLCNINGLAAGGDLSGYYPNPTVAKINGMSVPASSTGYLYNNGSGTLSWSLGGIWNQVGNTINYTNGNVGIGTNNPQYPLDVNGDAAVTGNLYGQNIYAANNLSAGNFRFVNGTAVGTADSIVSNAPALQLSANDVTVSTDTFKVDSNLSVTRNVVNIPGTLNAGNVQTPTLTITNSITSPVVYAGHIKPIPGDTAVHIGDSSLSIVTTGAFTGDLFFTPRMTGALGFANNLTNSGIESYAIGSFNNIMAPFSVTIGRGLTNTAPGSILMGYNAPALFINGTNQVGIGTTSPLDIFQVGDNMNYIVMGQLPEVGSTAYSMAYMGFNAARLTNTTGNWQALGNGSNNGGAVIIGDVLGDILFASIPNTGSATQTLSDATLISGTTNNIRLFIGATGNIGIGTTAPTYPLDVNGIIRANEIKVCLFGSCDFVFDDHYKLMSLDTLKEYLKLNHHLPGIASAEQMGAEGSVGLGKISSNLLQKVEELTLYTIKQDEKEKQQEEKIDRQEAELKELKAQLASLAKQIQK